MKRQKLETYYWTWLDGPPLTREQRRNFKRDHPGYKLPFTQRFPNLPTWIAVIALIASLAAPLLR